MKTLFVITLYKSLKFLPKQFSCLHQLDPKPDLTLFIINNSLDEIQYIRENYKLPFKICSMWFRSDATKIIEPKAFGIIGLIRQIGLDYFRHHKEYDWLMFVDDDIYILEKEYIKKMTEWNFDLIGAPYLRNFPSGVWLAAKWATTSPGKFLLRKPILLKYPLDTPAMISGGTMCISRRLGDDKRINFYPIKDENVPILRRMEASEDFAYCFKARHYGYQCYWRTDVKVFHDYFRTMKDPKPWTVKDLETEECIDFFY